MDISQLAAAASDSAQNQTLQAAQMTVLKKSMDIQEQSALQLLQALPQPSGNNPPHLGNTVDTFS